MSEQGRTKQRLVVKVGSSTLVRADGALDHRYIAALVDQLSAAVDDGWEVVLVSSGAIAAGREVLGLQKRPDDMATLQAAASIGQVALIEAYASELGRRRLVAGQVLLTRADIEDKVSYGHARDTFKRLLELGAVPVVNENDTVAVDEICFGDNDALAALVGVMLKADLVLLLTDVDGVYEDDPRINPEAVLLRELTVLDEGVFARLHSEDGRKTGSDLGSGGMRSKLEAAQTLLAANITTVLCNGREANVVSDALAGKPHGTVVRAEKGACS